MSQIEGKIYVNYRVSLTFSHRFTHYFVDFCHNTLFKKSLKKNCNTHVKKGGQRPFEQKTALLVFDGFPYPEAGFLIEMMIMTRTLCMAIAMAVV